jgi:molybdate transport system regulatory protein
MKNQRQSYIKKKKNKGFSLHGRLWIDGGKGTFLGHGRIVLLERIHEYGSISQAAKSMKMSYHHAWDLVNSMNMQATMPLVEKDTGGKGGGGARLTVAGDRAIKSFYNLDDRFKKFLNKEINLFSM